MEGRRSSSLQGCRSRCRNGLLVLAILCGGCAGDSAPRDPTTCRLEAGQSTAELIACGCFAFSRGASGVIGLDASDVEEAVQSVRILYYLCPIGTEGVARVLVVNGVAREVRR